MIIGPLALLAITVLLVIGGISLIVNAALDHIEHRRVERAREGELLRVRARAAHASYQLEQSAYAVRQAMLAAARDLQEHNSNH